MTREDLQNLIAELRRATTREQVAALLPLEALTNLLMAAEKGLSGKTRQDDISRFWRRVEKSSGCWLWNGTKNNGTYGAFKVIVDGRSKTVGAHRFSYEISTGRLIPPGFVVMHSCDTPSCVRPDHLSLGTYADNANDRDEKERKKIAELIYGKWGD